MYLLSFSLVDYGHVLPDSCHSRSTSSWQVLHIPCVLKLRPEFLNSAWRYAKPPRHLFNGYSKPRGRL